MADENTYQHTIADQLERIEQAKLDIIAAISDKGVTVEEGTRINDLDEKIRLIGASSDLDELSLDWYDETDNVNGDLIRNIEDGSMVIRAGRRTTSDVTVKITDIDPDALDKQKREELVAKLEEI